jgi:hypothetical protein
MLQDSTGDGLPIKNALTALKAPSSSAGLSIMSAPLHNFGRQNVRLLTATEQVGVSIFQLFSPVTHGTISLSTRYGLANVPYVIRRPCHPASSR